MECYKAYQKAYQKSNAERLRPVYKRARDKYNKTPKGRIAHKNGKYTRKHRAVGKFTLKQWQQLCLIHGNLCLRCKQNKPLTVDHIQPLANNGLNIIQNIQPLCIDCNRWKSTKNLDYRGDLI